MVKKAAGRVIGVIYSAIVPGLDEKHYDLVFTNDRVIAVYLGEYSRVYSRTGLSIRSDLHVYRILKSKKRKEYKDDDIEELCKDKSNIVIPYNDVSSIEIRKPVVRRAKDIKTVEFVELVLKTSSGLLHFNISLKAYNALKRIVNYVRRVIET